MSLPIFPTPMGIPSGQRQPQAPQGRALWRLGFRPFYLSAAAFATVSVPWWVASALGSVPWPTASSALWWHAHEMIFGFACAVIVGFLMTAGRAWTGEPTPRGGHLAALAALWLSARLSAMGGPGLPYGIHALLDVALLPIVAITLGRLLWRSGQRRQFPLIGLLGALAVTNAVFHAAVLGWLSLNPLRAGWAALAEVVLIECIMAGRVVPAFTMSATPGLQLTPPRHLSAAAIFTTAIGLAAWVAQAPESAGFTPQGLTAATLLGTASVLHLALLWSWRPMVTRHRPILWILHAAYAWIPIGLALLACASVGGMAVSSGVHALGVGATGGLIIGMITRTARGHTGRPLIVSRRETAAYALVMAAAVWRVALPLVGLATVGWIGAALAWSTAFALYLSLYIPWLTQPRIDGRDG